jgi:hypothetical protein
MSREVREYDKGPKGQDFGSIKKFKGKGTGLCQKYNCKHSGECKSGWGSCFSYGKEGHFALNSPNMRGCFERWDMGKRGWSD